MTFPAKLLRLQMGGSLYTNEQWSISFHFTTDGAVPPAENLKGLCEAFWTGISSSLRHDTANLGFVKCNEIAHDTGKYVDQGNTNAAFWAPEFHVAGTVGGLPQGALCVTLGTAKARGRGHSGRVYIPGYGAITATARLSAANCISISEDVAVFLNAVTTMDPGMTAVVWSKVGDSVEPITHTKTGDVVDTQRRRRGALPEVYWPGTVAVA